MTIIGRKRARKIITLPGGTQIPITLLNGFSSIDPHSRYQQYDFSINNTESADRAVHVDELYPSIDGENDTSGDPLKVERIDEWKVIDPHNRSQEHIYTFDNKTGSDSIPPHFSAHEKTHSYRYYETPGVIDDDGPWIEVEFLDQFRTIDKADRYQESLHTFTGNPEMGDMSWAPTDDDELISGYDGSDEKPIRTDPFQNIVNFNEGVYIVVHHRFQMINNFIGWSGNYYGSATDNDFSGQMYCLSTYTTQTMNYWVDAYSTLDGAGDFTGSTGLGHSVISFDGYWSASPTGWSTTLGVPPALCATGPYYGSAAGTNPPWDWTQGSPAPGNVPQSKLPTSAPWSAWGTNLTAEKRFYGDGPISDFIHGLLPLYVNPNNQMAAECEKQLAYTLNADTPTIVWNGRTCTPIGALADDTQTVYAGFWIIYRPDNVTA